MKRTGFLGGALILSALGTAACTGSGDDTSVTPAPVSDAGFDSAASPPVETRVSRTRPPRTRLRLPEAAPVEAGKEGGPADAGDASTPSYALFVGTDFTNAELSVVALHPDSVVGRLPVADEDSVPYASGAAGFVLEHTIGKVIVLDSDQPWMAKSTIDINDSPDAATAYASNPHAIVVTTGTKAYVARYSSNVIKIVDVGSATVTGSIDLSAFMAPDDTDGLVDVQDAAYDPATQRAYFLLQRINQFEIDPPPDYVGACLASHAEIVGVDATNDTIVDLNGAAAGDAINLLGDDPAALTPDFANGRLIVAETGCYQPSESRRRWRRRAGAAPRTGRRVGGSVDGDSDVALPDERRGPPAGRRLGRRQPRVREPGIGLVRVESDADDARKRGRQLPAGSALRRRRPHRGPLVRCARRRVRRGSHVVGRRDGRRDFAALDNRECAVPERRPLHGGIRRRLGALAVTPSGPSAKA